MAAAKLVTRCPACRTAFRLVADQLRLRQGLVRCGQCDTVFDAREHLIELPAPEAVPSPEPSPEPSPVAIAPQEPAQEASQEAVAPASPPAHAGARRRAPRTPHEKTFEDARDGAHDSTHEDGHQDGHQDDHQGAHESPHEAAHAHARAPRAPRKRAHAPAHPEAEAKAGDAHGELPAAPAPASPFVPPFDPGYDVPALDAPTIMLYQTQAEADQAAEAAGMARRQAASEASAASAEDDAPSAVFVPGVIEDEPGQPLEQAAYDDHAMPAEIAGQAEVAESAENAESLERAGTDSMPATPGEADAVKDVADTVNAAGAAGTAGTAETTETTDTTETTETASSQSTAEPHVDEAAAEAILAQEAATPWPALDPRTLSDDLPPAASGAWAMAQAPDAAVAPGSLASAEDIASEAQAAAHSVLEATPEVGPEVAPEVSPDVAAQLPQLPPLEASIDDATHTADITDSADTQRPAEPALARQDDAGPAPARQASPAAHEAPAPVPSASGYLRAEAQDDFPEIPAAIAREQAVRQWTRQDVPDVPVFAPDFLRHARERDPGPARRKRTLQKLAIGVLVAAALAQIAFLARSQLSGQFPALRPAFEALCAPLGCEVAPWRDIDALRIESSQLQKQDEESDVFLLAVTMRNQSRATVALPAIELVMTDLQDQLLLRKVLQPADYLEPGQKAFATQGLRAGTELPVRVRFRTQQAAANYRVLIFYP
ncbi:DUF3426 domain-containing protein [Cupriavidus sp. 2TAF22]|uniref:DUF3426 domain-containing protein n=1 Tax=unclassified Cupriavidus TaxID=2640874 RepID=UPI003F8EE1A2